MLAKKDLQTGNCKSVGASFNSHIKLMFSRVNLIKLKVILNNSTDPLQNNQLKVLKHSAVFQDFEVLLTWSDHGGQTQTIVLKTPTKHPGRIQFSMLSLSKRSRLFHASSGVRSLMQLFNTSVTTFEHIQVKMTILYQHIIHALV